MECVGEIFQPVKLRVERDTFLAQPLCLRLLARLQLPSPISNSVMLLIYDKAGTGVGVLGPCPPAKNINFGPLQEVYEAKTSLLNLHAPLDRCIYLPRNILFPTPLKNVCFVREIIHGFCSIALSLKLGKTLMELGAEEGGGRTCKIFRLQLIFFIFC